MQVTSMLSAGYLEPSGGFGLIKKARNAEAAEDFDESKQQREQEILAEEESLKAKLGSDAKVHTVYHYSLGSDGKRYIVGASVTMKGSEEDLNKVSGGVMHEDLQAKKQEAQDVQEALNENKTAEDARNIIKAGNERREEALKEDKAEEEKESQKKELEDIQREVIAHEAAHQAAAGNLGGGVSYTSDTIATLKDEADELFLIVGADMYVTLDRWHAFRYLFDNATILVAPRDELDYFAIKEKYEQYQAYGCRTLISRDCVGPLSSTAVRAAVKNGDSLSGMVDDRVAEYIRENGLYR